MSTTAQPDALDGSAPVGARPSNGGGPYRELERGLTWQKVGRLLLEKKTTCDERRLEHCRRGRTWTFVATPLTWLTAVLAALSGLSVVADYALAATVLSLTTAVVAATTAALNPADNARSHRAAATAYARLARTIQDYVWLTVEAHEGKQPVARDARAVMTMVGDVESQLTAIEDSHPPVGMPATRYSSETGQFSLGG